MFYARINNIYITITKNIISNLNYFKAQNVSNYLISGFLKNGYN